MNLLYKQILVGLLDDMVDVGLAKWSVMALVAALATWQLADLGYIVFIVGGVLTVNLAGAAAVTAWWRLWGRDKHVSGTLADLQGLLEGEA